MLPTTRNTNRLTGNSQWLISCASAASSPPCRRPISSSSPGPEPASTSMGSIGVTEAQIGRSPVIKVGDPRQHQTQVTPAVIGRHQGANLANMGRDRRLAYGAQPTDLVVSGIQRGLIGMGRSERVTRAHRLLDHPAMFPARARIGLMQLADF